MFETFKNAWRIPELKKKILYTLFILMVFRIGASIPVPYIKLEALKQLFASDAYTSSMLGFVNIFTGGGLSNATIFAMSITPYINAQIIMQLLTVAIPALERLAKDGGEEGRKKIAGWTRYVGVVLGLVQGFAYYTMLRSNSLVTDTTAWSAFVIVMSFTAGVALIMWLGEHITESGIGNGISVILFAGIISRGPSMVNSLYNLIINGGANIAIAALLIIMGIALIVFVVFMSGAERRIPIQYAKRNVGRKMYGGQSTHLPIKVSASGVMPIIFASSIMSLPSTVAIFYKPKTGSLAASLMSTFTSSHPIYIIVYLLLILAFSYFYATIQFNPIEIANNLKKNGGFIPGFRPGKPTSDFITKALSKVTFVGALFLGVIAALPMVIGAFNSSLRSVALGGTSVLIVVGVALDTMRQLEAQMMMRHHKGFLE